jgi:hypothetical protein
MAIPFRVRPVVTVAALFGQQIGSLDLKSPRLNAEFPAFERQHIFIFALGTVVLVP